MSNGLRGARKLGEAGAEQNSMERMNKKAIDSMDAAIDGIHKWHKQRQLELMKFKRGLLATDKDSSNCIKSTRRFIEGKEKAQIDEAVFQEDRALEQSIFISEQGSLRDETASTLQAVNNKACTTNMTVHPEINDPVSAAVETKLRQELAELQRKRQSQLHNFGPQVAEKEFSAEDAEACIRRNMAKYGLSQTQLKELTSDDSRSAQDLALIRKQVKELRSNTYASSISAKCRLNIDEVEVEKEAEKNGLDDVNKMQSKLDNYAHDLEDALLRLKALDK